MAYMTPKLVDEEMSCGLHPKGMGRLLSVRDKEDVSINKENFE